MNNHVSYDNEHIHHLNDCINQFFSENAEKQRLLLI